MTTSKMFPDGVFPTACPYDCPDCCGLLVTVKNGKAVKVAGDPAHPFTRGTLCPKMAHYERTVHHPGRLTTPLRRIGKKGEGKFEPISWDTAMETIASKFKDIIARYGAEAILPYSYAGTMGVVNEKGYHALFYHLGASNLARTICAPAKSFGYEQVMGMTLPTAPQEAQNSDCVVLWSSSMLATDIHFKHDIDTARQNGAKVWCIDTYETRTMRYADEGIRIRPGTDGAFALGVLHILDRDGLTDTGFIAKYVQGWDKLRAKVLPKYTPDHVASITGVPAARIEVFSHAYGGARAPFIRLGSGLTRYTNGGMTARLITCLPAAVGAYLHAGGGLLTSAQADRSPDRDLVRRTDWKKPGTRTINMIRLGTVLNDPNLKPPVKALYIYSSNPADTCPDQTQVLRGLRREDLFTVVHERFLTDTARFADIVLPATSSLEEDDLYCSYGNYAIQRGRAIIPPIGESKPNYEVSRLLAKAMGITDPFFDLTSTDLVEKLIASTTKWQRAIPDRLPEDANPSVKKQTSDIDATPYDAAQYNASQHDAAHYYVPAASVDQDCLREGRPTPLPLSADYKLRYGTPSGKIEIWNPAAEPPLPDFFPATGDAEPFHFVNAPDARILDSSFNEREELTQGHTMELLMNPTDARRLGLHDGQRVRARNTRGEVLFTLAISDRTNPGTVVTEGVWCHKVAKGHNTNALTSQRTADQAGASTFYDVNVTIESAE